MSPLAETALFAGYLVTIAGGAALVLSFARKLRGISEKIKAVCDGQQCQLRNDITKIFYEHVDMEKPTLREYERKNVEDLYAGYKALGGNHFIDDIYHKMRDWKVAP